MTMKANPVLHVMSVMAGAVMAIQLVAVVTAIIQWFVYAHRMWKDHESDDHYCLNLNPDIPPVVIDATREGRNKRRGTDEEIN
jgi:lysylphosphatidylglycerol synthetase-like protein (DUF2156 family)